MGAAKRLRLVGRIEERPGFVVIGTKGVGDAPMRHGAIRIGFQCPLETGDRLLMIVAVAPDETTVEPTLRIGVMTL